MNKKLFVAILCLFAFTSVLPPSSWAGDEKTETVSVFLYLVDVSNSMVGCPRCYNLKTDNVFASVVEEIVEEVRHATKPLEVYIVPFSRGIVDFDREEGPFDPWRKFEIRTDEDVQKLAEYIDPEKYAHAEKGSAPTASIFPKYGTGSDEQTWPGFAKVCAGKDYFTSALYDSIIAGLDFLRNKLPTDKEKRAAYIAAHIHRLTVFSDSENGVKTARFAHIVQSTELHRTEMDGRFWLSKVYVEGKTPDMGVNEETRRELEVARNTPGIFIRNIKTLPDPADMLVVEPLRISVTEKLDNPQRFVDDAIKLNLPEIKLQGRAGKIAAYALPSSIMAWPDKLNIESSGKESEKPFSNLHDDLAPSVKGMKAVFETGEMKGTAILKLTAEGDQDGKPPIFLASGAPEISIYLDIDFVPPSGMITSDVLPPGGAKALLTSQGQWNLGELTSRSMRSPEFADGRVTLSGNEYVVDPQLKVTFDPETVSLKTPEGRLLKNGEVIGVTTLSVKLTPPATTGPVEALVQFASLKPNLVFQGNEKKLSLSFRYQLKSDLPFYLLIVLIVVGVLAAIGLAVMKLLLTPPKINKIGGRLTMVRSAAGPVNEERDLSQFEKPIFTVGSGEKCDWVLSGQMIPYIAFVIELRRRESRLRIRKHDHEVENVKLNGQEMVECFLKDGDRIELLNHEFIFRF
jgi:hypothetical protein